MANPSYWCLREKDGSGTVGIDTSDVALVFLLDRLSYTKDNDVSSISIPFDVPILINLEASESSINANGTVMWGTSLPFSTLKLAIDKIEEMTGTLKLTHGTWDGTIWTEDTTGKPSYGNATLDAVLSRMQYDFDTEGSLVSVKISFELKIGTGL